MAEHLPDSLPYDVPDSVVIEARDGAIRRVPIRVPEMTIGRDADNDLVLDDAAVSRHHARLNYDGKDYRIVDLNSSNGTYLGSVRLLPGVPQVWAPASVLQIGDCSLRLEQGAPPPPGNEGGQERQAGPTGEPGGSGQRSERIALFAGAGELRVEPGASVTYSLTVLNQGAVVDHFQVSPAGLPAGWVPALPPVIRLLPGARQQVSLAIQPPRTPESLAGSYPFRIRVASQDAPDEVAEAQGTLLVGAYRQYDAEIRPQRGSGPGPGEFRLQIRNRGNADLTVQFAGLDPEEACAYSFDPAQAVVPPGGEGMVRATVRPKQPLQSGLAKTYAFAITVQPVDAPDLARQVRGEWVQTPPPLVQPQERPVGCSFCLLWALLTAIGGAIGGTVGLLVNLSQPVPLVGWAAVGACLGLLQWMALQRRLQRGGLWVAANAAGWAVAGPLTGAGTFAVWIVAGLLIGIPQWLILRGQVKRAVLWVPAAALGWAIGGYLAALSGLATTSPWGWVLAWAVGSAVCGVISSLPLLALLRSPAQGTPAAAPPAPA